MKPHDRDIVTKIMYNYAKRIIDFLKIQIA